MSGPEPLRSCVKCGATKTASTKVAATTKTPTTAVRTRPRCRTKAYDSGTY